MIRLLPLHLRIEDSTIHLHVEKNPGTRVPRPHTELSVGCGVMLIFRFWFGSDGFAFHLRVAIVKIVTTVSLAIHCQCTASKMPVYCQYPPVPHQQEPYLRVRRTPAGTSDYCSTHDAQSARTQYIFQRTTHTGTCYSRI